AAFVRLFPEHLFRNQVQSGQGAGCTHVKPLGSSVGADALHIQRHALFVHSGRGNALDELMPLLDVEHEDAMTAVLEVIANAWFGDVEKLARLGWGGGSGRSFFLSMSVRNDHPEHQASDEQGWEPQLRITHPGQVHCPSLSTR